VIRPPLSGDDHRRGRRLGSVLREARGTRSIADVAAAAGVSAETLRKIETGRVPTPAFFTIAAVAAELAVPLDALAALSEPSPATRS
jgi:transcriptional regulator with XRE-family HTH domain